MAVSYMDNCTWHVGHIDLPLRTETSPCEFFHPSCCYPQSASWCRWCCAGYCNKWKVSTKSIRALWKWFFPLIPQSVECYYLVLSYNQWRRSLGRGTDNSGSANGLCNGSWSWKDSKKSLWLNKTANVCSWKDLSAHLSFIKVIIVEVSAQWLLLQYRENTKYINRIG